MPDMQELDEQQIAEKSSATMHAGDHCAKTLNMSIDKVAPGYAEISMIIDKAYSNGYGVCQGGIITTLADTAFAHACNTYNRMTVAQGLSIEFVRPGVLGEKLTAIAEEEHRGKLTGVYKVHVYNPQQKLVAIFSGKSYEIGDPIY